MKPPSVIGWTSIVVLGCTGIIGIHLHWRAGRANRINQRRQASRRASKLLRVPSHLIDLVLSFLDIHDLAAVERTCSDLRRRANGPRLWAALYARTGVGRITPVIETNSRNQFDTLERIRLPRRLRLTMKFQLGVSPSLRSGLAAWMTIYGGRDVFTWSMDLLEMFVDFLLDRVVMRLFAQCILLPQLQVDGFTIWSRSDWRHKGSFQPKFALPSVGPSSIQYFETRILETGPGIAIGFAPIQCDGYGYLPGIRAHSIAMLNLIGCMLEMHTYAHAAPLIVGDVLGCGVDRHRFFFTLNGRLLDQSIIDLPNDLVLKDLRPSIGIYTGDVMVKVNFGWEPFMFEQGLLTMVAVAQNNHQQQPA